MILRVYCVLRGIKLSRSQEEVMSYLLVYKISKETKELIVNSGILKSVEAVANTLTELKKIGLLERDRENNSYVFVSDLNFKIDSKIGMLIKFDNT